MWCLEVPGIRLRIGRIRVRKNSRIRKDRSVSVENREGRSLVTVLGRNKIGIGSKLGLICMIAWLELWIGRGLGLCMPLCEIIGRLRTRI